MIFHREKKIGKTQFFKCSTARMERSHIRVLYIDRGLNA